MADGFTSHLSGDVLWRVHHNQGSTLVYASSEAIALQRFIAKYPKLKVSKIVRS